MKHQLYKLFLLDMSILFTITANVVLSKRSARTWGPRYCQSLCEARCSTYPGEIVEYHCHRTDAKSGQEQGQRREYCQCLKDSSESNQNVKISRLLIVRSRGLHCQMQLNGSGLIEYPYINMRKMRKFSILSVTYIQSQRKLVLGSMSNPGIYLVPLDSNAIMPVKHKLSKDISAGMAVDEVRQLVFMTSHPHNICIKVMTTEGTNLRIAFTFKDKNKGMGLKNIAVDSKRSKIFVVIEYTFVKEYTYSGEHVATISREATRALLFNQVSNVLYYGTVGNTVSEINVQNNKRKTFVKLSHAPENFVFDGSNLFVTLVHSAEIAVVDKLATLKYINKKYPDGMPCLVP